MTLGHSDSEDELLVDRANCVAAKQEKRGKIEETANCMQTGLRMAVHAHWTVHSVFRALHTQGTYVQHGTTSLPAETGNRKWHEDMTHTWEIKKPELNRSREKTSRYTRSAKKNTCNLHIRLTHTHM